MLSERPAVQAVLFDLDGTLLDTAADIALALQRAFAEHELQAPDLAGVRTMIGKGSPMLMHRAAAAQGLSLSAERHAAVLERFFHHYGRLQELGEFAAQPYAGAVTALQALQARGLPMAVVTNKQHRFACGLLDKLGLAAYFKAVVGGDTCERRKPDPQPLQYACTQVGVPPSRALMVGDSINDVQAARAAGMPVVCVPYGYNEGEDPRRLPCDAILETLADLPQWLDHPRRGEPARAP